jgi:hypothetical protein
MPEKKRSGCQLWFEGQDKFAEDYSLTFKSNPTYGTVLGGCCSLLAKFIFLLYGIAYIYVLIWNP